MRYASAPIDSEDAWDAANDVIGEPIPLERRSSQSMVVTDLPLRQNHYFSLRSRDFVGNLSPLSNSPSSTDPTLQHTVDSIFRVTQNTATEDNLDINGDYMVYQGDGDGDTDIYLYQYSTGLITRVSENQASDSKPKVSGDYVAWHGDEDGDDEIYLFQISTGVNLKLTDNSNTDHYADINGDYVTWINYDGEIQEIYLYQISTGTTQQISGLCRQLLLSTGLWRLCRMAWQT